MQLFANFWNNNNFKQVSVNENYDFFFFWLILSSNWVMKNWKMRFIMLRFTITLSSRFHNLYMLCDKEIKIM